MYWSRISNVIIIWQRNHTQQADSWMAGNGKQKRTERNILETLCPFCENEEITDHLFLCQETTQTRVIKKHLQKLQQRIETHLHRDLTNAIITALAKWCSKHGKAPVHDETALPDQPSIGWSQFMWGQLSEEIPASQLDFVNFVEIPRNQPHRQWRWPSPWYMQYSSVVCHYGVVGMNAPMTHKQMTYRWQLKTFNWKHPKVSRPGLRIILDS